LGKEDSIPQILHFSTLQKKAQGHGSAALIHYENALLPLQKSVDTATAETRFDSISAKESITFLK